MRQDKGLQTVVMCVLAIAVLVMSVGFASYTQDLNINGTATFAGAKWDVHFDNTSFTETGSINSSSHNVGTTDLTYAVSLPTPGSTYTFDIDIVNNGTFDAKLTTITMLPSTLPEYVEHIITYDGVDYTATTANINKILTKKVGNTPGSETVTVTVKYKDDVDTSLLPESSEPVNLFVTFSYVQVE